jgi:hypothetical protein
MPLSGKAALAAIRQTSTRAPARRHTGNSAPPDPRADRCGTAGRRRKKRPARMTPTSMATT